VTHGDAAAGHEAARRSRGTPAPGRRERALWLALLAANRGGLLKRLQGKRGTIDGLLALSPDEIRGRVGPARKGRMAPDDLEESTFRRLLAAGPGCVAAELAATTTHTSVVTWLDDEYPSSLREVADAPTALFLRGRAAQGLRDLERLTVVAVVGARTPSPYGREMTRVLARDLTDAGLLVISGMALGIDAVAQQQAVDAWERVRRAPSLGAEVRERVSTVAVLGCGVQVTYPRENARLAERICRSGLIVSEFPGDTPARPWRFPCRNRVIAGLARAVVVVEGSERSGSLLTAGFATQIGRDVLAVPGEAGRRLSAGPHRLLRRGAHVCESADDVLEAIGLKQVAWTTRRAPGLPADGPLGLMLAELDGGERSVDELAATLSAGVAEVGALLSQLEVDGLVVRVAAGRYRCRRG
jgi:DNA processing protein